MQRFVIFGRGKEALDEAMKELGSDSCAVQGDVGRLEDLENLFAEKRQSLRAKSLAHLTLTCGRNTQILLSDLWAHQEIASR